MESSGRLFNCARCRCQVIICSACDRNNIYCGKKCSQPAREESLRAAGRRYQESYRGRLKHAARQHAYRQRQKEKVTHHSSPVLPSNGLLPPELNKHAACLVPLATHDIRCHFCKRVCFSFLRIGFLRHQSRVDMQTLSSWPLGP
jgi:hypothetical protein